MNTDRQFRGGHGARLRKEIRAEAKRVQEEFMSSRSGSRGVIRERWSYLVLRVNKDPDDKTLSIDWLRRRWVGTRGNWKIFSTRIRKEKRFIYRKWDLMRWAQPWEEVEVWQAELKMALLREMWDHAKKLERLEGKYLPEELDTQEVDSVEAADNAVGFIPDLSYFRRG